ncbi:zinc finger protein SNAI3 [Arapaima gigas]
MPRSFLVKKHLSYKKPNYGELDFKRKEDPISPRSREDTTECLPFSEPLCPIPCPLQPLRGWMSGALVAAAPGSPVELNAVPAALMDAGPLRANFPLEGPPREQAFPFPVGHTSLRGSLSTLESQEPPDTSTFQLPEDPIIPEEQDRIPNAFLGLAASDQERRFECLGCRKARFTFSGLTNHRHPHCEWHCPRGFSCKYCDKEYASLGALKMHIRTHTLPCVCKLCGKAFSRPWLLQGHIRTHTGEKPFSCPHCSRAFADRSNLRAHLQTHSEVKKYQCKSCSKTFSRISLLSKHQEAGCCPLP